MYNRNNHDSLPALSIVNKYKTRGFINQKILFLLIIYMFTYFDQLKYLEYLLRVRQSVMIICI